MSYSLTALPYAFNALEPHIDALTMEIHHDRHHLAYINNLNAALDKHPELHDKTLESMISNLESIPEDVRTAIQNNGGGHLNHSLFWEIMTPGGSKEPVGELAKAIVQSFGSFENFKEKFAQAGATRFGSGWAWLVIGQSGLEIISTPNQDNPLSQGKQPILGLDVWEHAYYLKFYNKRPDYIATWWNVVNWNVLENRYQSLK